MRCEQSHKGEAKPCVRRRRVPHRQLQDLSKLGLSAEVDSWLSSLHRSAGALCDRAPYARALMQGSSEEEVLRHVAAVGRLPINFA